MVTVSQVRQMKLAELDQATVLWERIHALLSEVELAHRRQVLAPLEEHEWKGQSGEAALKYCTRTDGDIQDVGKEVKALRSFLRQVIYEGTSGKGLAELQGQMRDIDREAREYNMSIADDGSVKWKVNIPPGSPAGVAQTMQEDAEEKAKNLQTRTEEVLHEAARIESSMSMRLAVAFGTTENFESEDRKYNTEPATVHDRWVKAQLAYVLTGLRDGKHYDHAADLLGHWLGNTGEPYKVDPGEMMQDIPTFQKDVKTDLDGVRKQPDGTFTTPWKSTAPNPADGKGSMDWYYGLNHFQYRLVGTKENGKITYHVDVKKRYDWGIPSEQRSVVSGGGVSLEQGDIAHLVTVGEARDFNVSGTSKEMVA